MQWTQPRLERSGRSRLNPLHAEKSVCCNTSPAQETKTWCASKGHYLITIWHKINLMFCQRSRYRHATMYAWNILHSPKWLQNGPFGTCTVHCTPCRLHMNSTTFKFKTKKKSVMNTRLYCDSWPDTAVMPDMRSMGTHLPTDSGQTCVWHVSYT